MYSYLRISFWSRIADKSGSLRISEHSETKIIDFLFNIVNCTEPTRRDIELIYNEQCEFLFFLFLCSSVCNFCLDESIVSVFSA